MNKTAVNEIQKMNLLFERMNNHYTSREVEILSESKGQRQQVSRDQILDILDKQDENGAGKFVSIIYVKPVTLRKTKKSWDSVGVKSALDAHKDMADSDWHKGLTDFNSDTTTLKKNPISSIIVAQRYVLHWTTPNNYAKAYGEYSEKQHNLRMKYGVGIESDGMLGDNHNQREKSDTGAQFNQTGNLSRDFNMVGSTVKVTNYIVDDAGSIISEIPGDITKAISSPKKTYEVESSVAQALADNPEALAAYKAEKAEIDKTFRGQNFLTDRTLAIVATVDGVQYYFINDKLISPIAPKSVVNVNQEEMVKIAEEQLGETFNDIDAQAFAN